MSTEEELMREIIEILKGFTVVLAVILICIYCLFVGVAAYILVMEKKKHKKKSADTQPAEEKEKH